MTHLHILSAIPLLSTWWVDIRPNMESASQSLATKSISADRTKNKPIDLKLQVNTLCSVQHSVYNGPQLYCCVDPGKLGPPATPKYYCCQFRSRYTLPACIAQFLKPKLLCTATCIKPGDRKR